MDIGPLDGPIRWTFLKKGFQAFKKPLLPASGPLLLLLFWVNNPYLLITKG